MTKKTWKVFWDLQCPYSRTNWEQMAAIKEHFGNDYDISIHLTSLIFHPQAFSAQCAAMLIEREKGLEAKSKFVDACFTHQEKYMNAEVGDARPSEVDAIFASIAKEAELLSDEFTYEYFVSNLHAWSNVSPTYAEHKVALGYGVYGTPKHVIDDKLVPDTESSWGVSQWVEKLKTLG
jgi:2-hydroxychromene-2-carboxylate isomerase